VEGIKGIIIAITAPPEVRYARLVARNRAGEAGTTWNDFMRQEKVKTETSIPDITSRADIVFENNYKTAEELKVAAAEVYEKKLNR